MKTSKQTPFIQFFDLIIGSNTYFNIKYKHLIVNNLSGDTITGRIGQQNIFILSPNDVLELLDIFKSEQIDFASGVKVNLTTSGANSAVRIWNFGV